MLTVLADHKRWRSHVLILKPVFTQYTEELTNKRKAFEGERERQDTGELLGRVWRREIYSDQMALGKTTSGQNQKKGSYCWGIENRSHS